MSYLARLKQLESEKNYHFTPRVEPPKPTKAPFGSFDSTSHPQIEKKIIAEKKLQSSKGAETYHGLTLAELKDIAGEDWPDIEHNPIAIEALADAIQTRRMRERGEVPPHYTQIVHCDGCGPVWLWQGSPERIQACPWCFVRVQGITPPQAAPSPSLTLDVGHTVHGVIVARDLDTSAESYRAAGMVRCNDCTNNIGGRCGVDNAQLHPTKWRRCGDFLAKP